MEKESATFLSEVSMKNINYGEIGLKFRGLCVLLKYRMKKGWVYFDNLWELILQMF